jgi:hypothetical protein
MKVSQMNNKRVAIYIQEAICEAQREANSLQGSVKTSEIPGATPEPLAPHTHKSRYTTGKFSRIRFWAKKEIFDLTGASRSEF